MEIEQEHVPSSWEFEEQPPTEIEVENEQQLSSSDIMEIVQGEQVSPPSPLHPNSLRRNILIPLIAIGIQYGAAIQLASLTPYAQLLGIPHTWVAVVWLSAPVSAIVVQPFITYWSNHCPSRFGRRRPFMIGGLISFIFAALWIAFAADFGHALGDTLQAGKYKYHAITAFIVGAWLLEAANNTILASCRALLTDLSGGNEDQKKRANNIFDVLTQIGGVLGFMSSAFTNAHDIFHFSQTLACDNYCANVKSCFLISILSLLILITIAVKYIPERPWTPQQDEAEREPVPYFSGFRNLRRGIWVLLLVTSLSFSALFSFNLFSTDWVGREIFGGDPIGDADKVYVYESGARHGALGMMIYCMVVFAFKIFTTRLLEELAPRIGGVTRLLGIGNCILATCLGMAIVISTLAGSHQPLQPPSSIKRGTLVIFAFMGISQVVIDIIPPELVSKYASGVVGDGLILGLQILPMVIPQIVLSVLIGPFDSLFGGGNIPGFVLGILAAGASAIIAFTMLPSPPTDDAASIED